MNAPFLERRTATDDLPARFNPDLFRQRFWGILPFMKMLMPDCRMRRVTRRIGIGTVGLTALAFLAMNAVAQAVFSPTNSISYTFVTNSDRTITISRYTGTNGSVVIPGNINGQPVSRIGNNAFDYCKPLTGVTIPDSVTIIGKRAFSYCSGLTHVELGKGVVAIGEQAFFYCHGLPNVTIPDSVVRIGDRAFHACSSLTQVTFGQAVSSIGNEAFAYCSSLTNVAIGDNVNTIGTRAFESCSSLACITIPARTVRIGNGAFRRCGSLSNAYFLGNAPDIGAHIFDQNDQAVVYYTPDSLGWGNTFGGHPTALRSRSLQPQMTSEPEQTPPAAR